MRHSRLPRVVTGIRPDMSQDTVVVPPGHKVIVVKPTAAARVGAVPSGLVIVDYGQGGDWRQVNAQLDAAMAERSASAVVILQDDMIESLKGQGELDEFIAYWKAQKAGGRSAVWVLPLHASAQASVIALIRGAGFGVHASAPDGACFVEVHKPDRSITIGMPGPAI